VRLVLDFKISGLGKLAGRCAVGAGAGTGKLAAKLEAIKEKNEAEGYVSPN
jgi:hypothetical protein